MREKFRLVFGRRTDAPFADSALVCLLIAMILAAGSVFLWNAAADTLGLARESAAVREITVASAETTGEGGYAPRLEITGADGETFSILRSAVGEEYDAFCEKIQPGDLLTLRLSRRGNVLEVEQNGEILLDFASAAAQNRSGAILNLAAAVLFDALALLIAARAAALHLNRRKH